MVNKILFTEESVVSIPFAEKGERIIYRDTKDRYLHLNVSQTNKTFLTIKKAMGRTFYVTLGNHPTLTVKDARKECGKKVAALNDGVNVTKEKQDRKQAEVVRLQEEKAHSTSLQESLDEYLNKGKLKPRTVSTYKDLCRLYLDDWLDKPAAEITREMVKARHTEIATGKRQRQKLEKEVTKEGGKAKLKKVLPPDPKRKEAAADNCMRTLRAILNYAFEDEEGGIPYSNPVNILSSRKKKAWFKVDRRRTLIKNSDLPAWFKAVDGLDNHIMRDFLLFILFTGLRRKEASTLKWNQVDFEEGCFTLIGGISGVTKNKEYHTLPLSDYLHTLLTNRKEGLKIELAQAKAAFANSGKTTLKLHQSMLGRIVLAESRLASQYVFPGEGKTGYIVEPKKAIDAVTAATGISFSCHDLRRTFATLAESLDLSSYTVKALLNHKQQTGDVTGGYIILNVDRLREPMQRVTDAIIDRINRPYGKVVDLQSNAK
jgi:integrase